MFLHHDMFCFYLFIYFRASYLSFYYLIDRGGCHARGRVCLLYLGYLVPRVTSRCVRRSVMSARRHNGTTGTSRCVRCSVISAMDFHRSVVSAYGHNGTPGKSRYVRRSVMSADNFRNS